MRIEEFLSGRFERAVIEREGPEGILYSAASKGWRGPERRNYAMAVSELRDHAALEAKENRYRRAA